MVTFEYMGINGYPDYPEFWARHSELIENYSSSQIQINFVIYSGAFTFDDDGQVYGSISRIWSEVSRSGEFLATNLDLNAFDFFSLMDLGDTENLIALLFSGNDLIQGSDGTRSENFFGGAGRDTIQGYAGFDTIDGGLGDDLIVSGAGHDLIIENYGNDSIDGGADYDVVELAITSDQATLVSATSDFSVVTLSTEFGVDRYENVESFRFLDREVIARNIESLGAVTPIVFVGTNASEHIHGGQADDTLIGGGGIDFIYGYDGSDLIYGGGGHVYGGDGDDVFVDSGGDPLSGGNGYDIARFSSPSGQFQY